MKLSEWLSAPGHKRTQDALGRKVGVTQGRISQIAQAGTGDLSTALAIQAATDNEVTVSDLVPIRPQATESDDGEGVAA